MAYTLKSGSEGKFLEEKFVKWDEVGLVGPDQSPGLIWYSGDNSNGQLGNGTTIGVAGGVTQQLGSRTDWKFIEAGNANTFMIDISGRLYATGYNGTGELGLGDLTHRSSPVQVGSLTNWKQVTSGIDNSSPSPTLAIRTDGTLWAWGYNYKGLLGLGDTTNRSSPVQVGSLTNWKEVSSGGADAATGAIKTDGTLWAWGSNSGGRLGLGDFIDKSSPVQVGSLTNWKQISAASHFMAIKTDGTLWAWGNNSQGQLGLGDTASQNSPVQVGSLTNWKQVTAVYYYCTYAIKTDGTLWAWGYNLIGSLGLGDTTSRSSPTQVGSLTNWKFIDCGYQDIAAVKTDGTLWSLGVYNTSASSPIQIGTSTKWKTVSAGRGHIFATQYNY